MSVLITNKSGSSSVSSTNNYANSLINSNFDFNQRALAFGTAPNTVVSSGNVLYIMDRWYSAALLGTGGDITASQVTASNVGSEYGLFVRVTTAPSTGGSSSFFVSQTLSNGDSQLYYNGVGSFSALIRAVGNITQVSLQFMSATTEVKNNNTIGPAVVVNVNSSGFTLCSIINQAMGTAFTRSGVVGIQISPSAVSSGNVTDATNGLVIEQAIMTPTSTLLPYRRSSNSIQAELALCLAYCATYIASYATQQLFGIGAVVNSGAMTRIDITPQVTMRAVPLLSAVTASNFALIKDSVVSGVTSITLSPVSSPSLLSMTVTPSSTLTAGIAELIANNTNAASLIFDADL